MGADTNPPVNDKFIDLAPAIAELRQEVGQDRRLIMQARLMLTHSENPRFWLLYDEHRIEQNKVGDRKVRLITNFIAERDGMSEDDARKLNWVYFAIEKDRIAVKEKYVAKMSKVLSTRTVARLFQIDQKPDAIADVALAAKFPLIK